MRKTRCQSQEESHVRRTKGGETYEENRSKRAVLRNPFEKRVEVRDLNGENQRKTAWEKESIGTESGE